MGSNPGSCQIFFFFTFFFFFFLAHLSWRLIGQLIVYKGIRRPSVNIFKRHLLWSREADSFHISHIAYIGRGNEKMCFFYSNRIRTLVAMATYSSHRLIMGKEEIDIFFCLIGDIWNFFYRNVYWVVLYVSFDFCPNQWIWLVVGAAKSVNFYKNV